MPLSCANNFHTCYAKSLKNVLGGRKRKIVIAGWIFPAQTNSAQCGMGMLINNTSSSFSSSKSSCVLRI